IGDPPPGAGVLCPAIPVQGPAPADFQAGTRVVTRLPFVRYSNNGAHHEVGFQRRESSAGEQRLATMDSVLRWSYWGCERRACERGVGGTNGDFRGRYVFKHSANLRL